MSDVPAPLTVAAAEAQAAAAKQRLTATLGLLKARIAPKSLVHEATQGLITKTQDIAQDGIDTARKHPLPFAGALAALGLFLARKPLGRLVTRAKPDATPDPATSLTTNPRPAKRKPS